jgi:serine/threonine-protein kinase HipA
MGRLEYSYNLMAAKCGIRTEQSRLLPSLKTSGYFACRRFDRTETNERIHMVSAGGLLEISHRFPVLDYSHLLKLTNILTKDERETENMFRLMCFNEFAHNRDDHSKNFSFLYDEKKGKWIMSPAYDLTYSSSVNGEHATTINGNGKNPTESDVLKVGRDCGLNQKWCKETLESIRETVNQSSKPSITL